MGVGFLLGFGGHLAASHWGISMAAWGLDEMELSGVDFADLVIYSEIRPIKWVIGSIVVALATVGSSLYPAWRAARLAPAEAMRFFE
jgi:ABC-type antimicrobial peptide transport system permease subunit